MQIKAIAYDLKFRYPFRLATATRTHTAAVLLAIHHEGYTGYGEAALPPYREETQQSVLQFLNDLDAESLGVNTGLDGPLEYLNSLKPGNYGAKAAVDIALHDLYCKMHGIKLSEHFGITVAKPLVTSYTLGISSEVEMVQKIKDAADFRLIKLKLGTAHDAQHISNYLKHCDKPFFADANQGWADCGYAREMSSLLQESGALFVEQPMPADRWDDMERLAEACSNVTFVADESVQTISDISKVSSCFKGINIKLMKCGGLAGAHQMILMAKSLGLLTVIGCMSESSCGVSAAAHIAALAGYADLDGPLLIDNDPFTGVVYQKGCIVLPEGDGTGAKLCTPIAGL